LEQHAFGFLAVKEKTSGHKHENTQPEDEAAFSLQAGFAEQVFKAAIGHESLPFKSTRPHGNHANVITAPKSDAHRTLIFRIDEDRLERDKTTGHLRNEDDCTS
jgi:hypothetical protein